MPIAPLGEANAFDPSSNRKPGVQVYSVEYMFEYDGAPFATESETTGWQSPLSSLAWSTVTQDATAGQLVIWATDGEQVFPSGFGGDGLLFTDDDPLAGVEQGWSGVDISGNSFDFSRETEYNVEIIEGDTWFYDLSDLGYVEAFTGLMDTLEVRYPFTEEKDIDWDAIRDDYIPAVERAERATDSDAFGKILYNVAMEFGDGHVSAQISEEIYEEEYSGYLGIQSVETNRGELVVDWIWDMFPLGNSDIEVGAEIVSWNGRDPGDAIDRESAVAPSSSEHADR